MVILGVLIALGSAVAFVLIGALALFGSADATRQQIVPGFLPDRPGAAERALTFLSVWGPALLVALLSLLAGIQILRMALNALL